MTFAEGDVLPWWESALEIPRRFANLQQHVQWLIKTAAPRFDSLFERACQINEVDILATPRVGEPFQEMVISLPIGSTREFVLTHPQLSPLLRQIVKDAFWQFCLQDDPRVKAFINVNLIRWAENLGKQNIQNRLLCTNLGGINMGTVFSWRERSGRVRVGKHNFDSAEVNRCVSGVAMLAMVDSVVPQKDELDKLFSKQIVLDQNSSIEPT
ncbi:hypothetical protein HY385_02630 [Candidatus Daviesbacteria bacterium]|nr:hypothetical protein [Candidatus Daviesbacteria bacterium]